MPVFLLATDPASLYIPLGLLALALAACVGYYIRHVLKRRFPKPPPEGMEAILLRQDGMPAAPAPPPDSPSAAAAEAETAGREAVAASRLPYGSPVLHWALVLLACVVAAGFLLLVIPQSAMDRWAQALRLRADIPEDLEPIAFLYLGDEMKGQEFHIRGVVRNISTRPIEKLDATIRLYSSDGKLIETAIVRLDSELIAPDATSTFNLAYPNYAGQFASYAVDFKLRNGNPLPYKDMRGARERN